MADQVPPHADHQLAGFPAPDPWDDDTPVVDHGYHDTRTPGCPLCYPRAELAPSPTPAEVLAAYDATVRSEGRLAEVAEAIDAAPWEELASLAMDLNYAADWSPGHGPDACLLVLFRGYQRALALELAAEREQPPLEGPPCRCCGVHHALEGRTICEPCSDARCLVPAGCQLGLEVNGGTFPAPDPCGVPAGFHRAEGPCGLPAGHAGPHEGVAGF